MYDLDEISDDYDLSIVLVKHEESGHLFDELLKYFYLDLMVEYLNNSFSPRRRGQRFNVGT